MIEMPEAKAINKPGGTSGLVVNEKGDRVGCMSEECPKHDVSLPLKCPTSQLQPANYPAHGKRVKVDDAGLFEKLPDRRDREVFQKVRWRASECVAELQDHRQRWNVLSSLTKVGRCSSARLTSAS
jgi:hypothetical protein